MFLLPDFWPKNTWPTDILSTQCFVDYVRHTRRQTDSNCVDEMSVGQMSLDPKSWSRFFASLLRGLLIFLPPAYKISAYNYDYDYCNLNFFAFPVWREGGRECEKGRERGCEKERGRGGKAENESTARQIQNDHARSHHATWYAPKKIPTCYPKFFLQ